MNEKHFIMQGAMYGDSGFRWHLILSQQLLDNRSQHSWKEENAATRRSL